MGKAKKAYRVTAPYVTVRVANQGSETVLGFYEGGVLPEAAIQESLDVLLAKGMIEETDAPTPEAQAEVDAKAEAKADEAAEKVAAETAAKEEAAAEEAAAKGEAEDEAEESEEEPATGVPAASASKADWVAYAVSLGADQAEAEAKTKADLVAEYGG